MTIEIKQKIMLEIIEWTKSIGFALVIGAIILIFVRPSVVFGDSMLPTLEDKNLLLLEKTSYLLGEPERGDIVVIRSDLQLYGFMKKKLIKRVIGLPGDTIVIGERQVFINGVALEEDYLKDERMYDGFTGTVPEGHVFVLGDNRNNSTDSRKPTVGFVPYSKIQGKAYFRIFPFDKIGAM
ncbi:MULTISPECIES: signal peptidase I [unclassified Fusibacter]|uniref:signal peptidase I n=1 Tax=unclassified Fusibacter TaxID=2624464 RepID=UPI001A9B57FF|nr:MULTISPECIES: signal peptidase I [unclassified Fusibacter]MCK8060926.1 signal peptidase I [Fusibacter sp. A2]